MCLPPSEPGGGAREADGGGQSKGALGASCPPMRVRILSRGATCSENSQGPSLWQASEKFRSRTHNSFYFGMRQFNNDRRRGPELLRVFIF